MNALKMAAILLIAAGALGIGYGGFSYTRETHEADIGSLHLSVDEKQHVRVPIWAGIAAMVLGGFLLVVPVKN